MTRLPMSALSLPRTESRRQRTPWVLAAWLGLAAVTSAGGPQSAQQADRRAGGDLPAGKAVIGRYVQALGGRSAILKYRSSHARGRFEMPAQGISGEMEAFAASPNRMRITISIPGIGQVSSGFDGKVGWSVDPLMGPMILEGKRLEQARQEAEFYAALHEEKDFKSIETLELTDFEGKPCYKLRLVRASGDELFEFYDKETGLLFGSVASRESPMGPLTATTVLSEYRPFAGLPMPTRIVQRLMVGQEIVSTITSIEFDTVEDSVFEPPAAIKALIRR